MAPALSEDFDKKIGATIDHLGMIAKIRSGVHHPQDLYDILHAIEIAAKCVTHGGNKN